MNLVVTVGFANQIWVFGWLKWAFGRFGVGFGLLVDLHRLICCRAVDLWLGYWVFVLGLWWFLLAL